MDRNVGGVAVTVDAIGPALPAAQAVSSATNYYAPDLGYGEARTTGATAGALTFGSYPTDNGLTWTYRDATARVANPTLAAGLTTVTVSAYDRVGNATTLVQNVERDSAAPTLASCSTPNGGVAGSLDNLDRTVLTFSEAMDPGSMSAGWTGVSQLPMTATLVNAGNNVLDYISWSIPVFTGGTTPADKFSLGHKAWNAGPNHVFGSSTFTRTSQTVFTAVYGGGTAAFPNQVGRATVAPKTTLTDPAGNAYAAATPACTITF